MSIYAVLIDGWDQRSTWGWDDGTRSYYAQLTRNGNSDDNGPEIWITPPAWPNLSAPEHLAMAIAAATRTDRAAVQNAMNNSLDDSDGQRHRIRNTNPAARPQAKPSAGYPSTERTMTTLPKSSPGGRSTTTRTPSSSSTHRAAGTCHSTTAPAPGGGCGSTGPPNASPPTPQRYCAPATSTSSSSSATRGSCGTPTTSGHTSSPTNSPGEPKPSCSTSLASPAPADMPRNQPAPLRPTSQDIAAAAVFPQLAGRMGRADDYAATVNCATAPTWSSSSWARWNAIGR
ncbi:hypothetical protein [Micromonospora aurantiaca (nom. illeg.)]|uniref:hypothetical protein n=1 Tax=Micromonospora aurantiaca (nom. illeg.) TaxID=47850 RepID=UPI0033DCB734